PDVRAPPPVVGPYSLSEANKHFTADLIGAVADPTTGSSLLAGFITTADQFSQVWLDVSRRSLSALSFADGISVGPGQTLASEKLLVDVCGPPLDALARYGQTLGRQMGALGWDHVPTGWCSWYYYWGGISEEAMLENLEFLSRHRDELPVEYIQLDDGFQADIGDWTTLNQKFPHSLGWLAQRIHDKGFKAGLWLAPFLAASTSALYRQHPDWVVRDGRGEPVVAIPNWGKDCYGLDCTHPEVQAWLRKLVKTAVQEWGFDYLKLDFLYGAAVEGRRYDPQATRAQAYRRGLDILRQGAGDRFILGCGAPIGLSIGLINANRVGPDVAPFWRLYPPRDNAPLAAPGTENALRTVLARHWTHGSLWLNDPDCLLVRDSETALSLGETHCLATAVALSGGMVFLSDALARLSPQRRQIASLLLPPYGRAAEPLDLLEHSPPRFSQLAVERPFEQWWLLGVFQWDEQPTDVRAPLPAEPVHVYDLWEDRYFGVHQGEILFPAMEPHSAKLLALRRLSDQPQIVSTTFHFSQGGVEIEDARFDAARGALTVELVRPAKKEGEVLVYVPPTYQERAVESDAPAVAMARRPDGLLSVRLTLTERAHLAVLFDH
ncbi:MAG: alpha-galactosidase, partial [Chloroflexota bacterium]|nr:alpha-galactosidase [Chloroflexota bacterium]